MLSMTRKIGEITNLPNVIVSRTQRLLIVSKSPLQEFDVQRTLAGTTLATVSYFDSVEIAVQRYAQMSIMTDILTFLLPKLPIGGPVRILTNLSC